MELKDLSKRIELSAKMLGESARETLSIALTKEDVTRLKVELMRQACRHSPVRVAASNKKEAMRISARELGVNVGHLEKGLRDVRTPFRFSTVTPTRRTYATHHTKCPLHNSPDCFKPTLDTYFQLAYDGYCTKIDWPYWRIIPKGWTPK